MKKNYEKPTLRTSSLTLEGFLCVSGQPMCSIYPICADVEGYENMGTAEYDAGEFIM